MLVFLFRNWQLGIERARIILHECLYETSFSRLINHTLLYIFGYLIIINVFQHISDPSGDEHIRVFIWLKLGVFTYD